MRTFFLLIQDKKDIMNEQSMNLLSLEYSVNT